jgi:hypothetical protein
MLGPSAAAAPGSAKWLKYIIATCGASSRSPIFSEVNARDAASGCGTEYALYDLTGLPRSPLLAAASHPSAAPWSCPTRWKPPSYPAAAAIWYTSSTSRS